MELPKGVYRWAIPPNGGDQEVVFLVLEPGASIPFHDHGDSEIKSKVFEGQVEEQVIDQDTKMLTGPFVHHAGEETLEKKGTIHSIRNPSTTQRAIIMNICEPPLGDTMTFYSDEELGL